MYIQLYRTLACLFSLIVLNFNYGYCSENIKVNLYTLAQSSELQTKEDIINVANTVFKEFNLGNLNPFSVVQLGGGKFNVPIKALTLEGNAYVIRYLNDKFSEDLVAFEYSVHDYLFKVGFPVSRQLSKKNSYKIVEVNSKRYVVYEFSAGKPLEDIGLGAKKLATYHKLMYSFEPDGKKDFPAINYIDKKVLEFTDVKNNISEISEQLRESQDQFVFEIADNMCQHLKKLQIELEKKGYNDLKKIVIHGDYAPNNINQSLNSKKIRGLFDWDNMRFEIPMYDVLWGALTISGVGIGDLDKTLKSTQTEDFKRFILEYMKIRPLSDEELEILPQIYKAIIIEFLSWPNNPEKRLSLRKEPSLNFYKKLYDTLGKIDQYNNDWKKLIFELKVKRNEQRFQIEEGKMIKDSLCGGSFKQLSNEKINEILVSYNLYGKGIPFEHVKYIFSISGRVLQFVKLNNGEKIIIKEVKESEKNTLVEYIKTIELNSMKNKKFNFPKIYKTFKGDYTVVHDGQIYMLVKYIESESGQFGISGDNFIQQASEQLAQIHALFSKSIKVKATKRDVIEEFCNKRNVFLEKLNIIKKKKSETLSEKEKLLVQNESLIKFYLNLLNELDSITLPMMNIYGDFSPNNFLIKNNKIISIIDPRPFYSTRLQDIISFFSDPLIECQNSIRELNENFKKFISFYQSEALLQGIPLKERELIFLPKFYLLSLLNNFMSILDNSHEDGNLEKYTLLLGKLIKEIGTERVSDFKTYEQDFISFVEKYA